MWRNHIALLLATLLTACDPGAPAATHAGEWTDLRAPVTITDWPLPTLRPGTHSPALSATHDGRLLLNWVNSQRGRRHVLQFSAYDLAHQRWRGAPLTVVIGSSLYIDPDHSPRVIASRDGALWAQWWQGQKPDVMFSRSRDGGANWSEPQMPYADPERIGSDQIAVQAWPEGDQGIGMTWMAQREDGGVSLRATRIDGNGAPAPAVTLNERVNECEPPGIALTARGPLLAWRGWDADGMREVLQVARHDATGWTPPMRMIDLGDGGSFPCLDVNGPLIAAHAGAVVMLWSTLHEHDEEPWMLTRAAVSADSGDRFAAPVDIRHGAGFPFALAMDAQQVWIVWLQLQGEDDDTNVLWLSRHSLDLREQYERREIARMAEVFNPAPAPGHPRAAGLPRFVLSRGIAYLVWSEERATGTTLRGVKIQPMRNL